MTTDIASLLRMAAEGREEYAANAPAEQAEVLRIEANTLRHAANVADGDLRVMRSWLPSWWWDRIPVELKPVSDAPAAPIKTEKVLGSCGVCEIEDRWFHISNDCPVHRDYDGAPWDD